MDSGKTEGLPGPEVSSYGEMNGSANPVSTYHNEELPTTPEAIKKEKRKIMKNICLISVAFLFNFTAYNGLARLQSSLHKDEGMGTITQSVLYGALVISCMFIPKLLIGALGHKWTIPLSFSGYILWMAANGYAVWGTMVTSSILVGICAAPLWTAQCAYFTKIASRYSKLTGEKEETVVTRFFGIFFFFFQMSSIFGSIISFTILMPEGDPDANNATLTPEQVTLYCGVKDCPWNNVTNPNLAEPTNKTLWTMVGTYIAAGCVAVILVCAAVDRLPKYMRENKEQAKKEAKENAVNTFMHLKNRAQLLLIPITIYSGVEQAFYGAEWNKSFISCGMGIYKVGLVTLPFGVVNAIVSFTGGHIVKYIGRIPLFTIGMCADLAIQFTMLFWPLDKDKEYVFYILSGAWGLTDGIWQTQINALYGSIFADNSEAAFSNYRMWESLGFIVTFAYSSFLCTDVKLYVTMSVLVVGMILYYVTEGLEKQSKSSDVVDATNSDAPPKLQYKRTVTEFDNVGFDPISSSHPKANDYGNKNTTQDTWPPVGETYGYENGAFTKM